MWSVFRKKGIKANIFKSILKITRTNKYVTNHAKIGVTSSYFLLNTKKKKKTKKIPNSYHRVRFPSYGTNLVLQSYVKSDKKKLKSEKCSIDVSFANSS